MMFFGLWLLLCTQLCLAAKFNDLVETIGNSHILTIDDSNWRDVSTNEDYSLVVFLTASDPRVGCVLCAEASPKWVQVAESYYENLKSSGTLPLPPADDIEEEKARYIIALADFTSSQQFFSQLNVNSVPKIFFYSPGKAINLAQPQDQYRFTGGDTAQQFSSWITSHSTKSDSSLFKIVEKPDYQSLALTLFTIFALAFAVYKQSKRVTTFFSSRRLWRGVSMLLCILFISGYMYNRIRNTDFTGKARNGGTIVWSPSQQNQYGVETQIVAVLYAFLAVSVIIVMDTAGKIKDAQKRFAVVLVATGATYLLYSYLLCGFAQKSAGYPYKMMHIF